MADEVKSYALAAGTGYVFIGKPETLKENQGEVEVVPGTLPPAHEDLKPWIPGGMVQSILDFTDSHGNKWLDIGNTSLENGIELANEGDDPEVLGSWQNPAIKTTTPAKTFSLTIACHDFTAQTFRLYYGSKDGADANGNFKIPTIPQPQEHSLLIVAVDGDEYLTFYYPKVSFIGTDSVTLDPSTLSEIPVKGNILGSAQVDGMGMIGKKRKLPSLEITGLGGLKAEPADKTAELTWDEAKSPIGLTVSYEVTVRKDENSDVVFNKVVSTNKVTADGLEPQTGYRWDVEAKDGQSVPMVVDGPRFDTKQSDALAADSFFAK
ncbi:fibronectin type III domain-containing protein [Streptomyces sp. NPDC127112]|uniref:fibronectin type III domain-containing protein n=1 Tax=Streptomyces sp. NPDC127112 TaxID=3345364 RepID=UPI0036258519